MKNFRTDLAVESHSLYLKESAKELDGIISESEKTAHYTVTKVQITTDSAAKKLNKPKGNYITIHSEHIGSGMYTEELSKLLAKEVSSIMPSRRRDSLIFAAGLGNDKVTPDSVGPKVISDLIVSRHLFKAKASGVTSFLSPLCALAPGVLGITGIETADIFSSVTHTVKPDFIIAVDALAARSSTHVGTTLQISDTGINPGSGVNNRRSALNLETLGVPVIVIGIPTVSDASAVVYDAISEILSMFDVSASDEKSGTVITDVLSKRAEAMMVTPKNIDAITERASLIISRGINLAVHPDLSYQDITDYTS